MAKAKKEVEPELSDEIFASEKLEETLPIETISEQPVYIPDTPAQMIEQPVTKAEIDSPSDKLESNEILFLRKILQIQEEGCFGKHLNQMIYEKIKELKNVG